MANKYYLKFYPMIVDSYGKFSRNRQKLASLIRLFRSLLKGGLIIVALLGCDDDPGNQERNVKEYTLVDQDDIEIHYFLSFPANFTKTDQYPLMIALHGGGIGDSLSGYRILKAIFEPALEETDFLIVTPKSTARVGWEPVIGAGNIRTVITDLQARYRIDTTRIFVTGYSQGAIMAWQMVESYPELFTGAIPVSGRYGFEAIPYDPRFDPIPPENAYPAAQFAAIIDVPFYVINSRLDLTFLFDIIHWQIEQLQEVGLDITFHIVDDLDHSDVTGFIEHFQAALPWMEAVAADRSAE
ncbi:MAG: hypothetical protein ABIA75_05130 [Candidatus Neomarinimicrobiota bacterium]